MRFKLLTTWKDNKELISAIQSNDVEYPLYKDFLEELRLLTSHYAGDTITIRLIKEWFGLRAHCVTVQRGSEEDKSFHDELMIWLDDVKEAPFSIELPRSRVKVKNRHNAIRWNVPDENNQPLLTANCTDHSAVHRVSYELVSSLLETSGCSKEEPYWIHSVIGGLHTSRGVQLVCPGDWIVEPLEGVYLVLTHDQYLALYGAKAQAA